MEARILNQSEEYLWSAFVEKHPQGNIHQTPEWGRFRSHVPGNDKYWIIVIEENSAGKAQIIAGTLLIRQSLPRGYSWLYAPRGPLLNYEDFGSAQTQMSVLMDSIKELARKEKAIFFRVDPLIEICMPNVHTNSEGNISPAPITFPHFRQNIHGFQPDHTLLLDLTPSEDDILKQMKPKGRYNIKLAEKKGVTIRKSTEVEDFYKILAETTSRDGFHGHDQKFYQNMIEALGKHAALYLAEFEGQIIAGCLNTFYKNTATYYYGASSNEHRNVMAPYLLHWHAISEAKSKGYNFYDFFGIAPENAVNHAWAGVTEFKKKFGGIEVSYQKPQEFVFKKALYFIYRTYKKVR